jgi:hypothetical protein
MVSLAFSCRFALLVEGRKYLQLTPHVLQEEILSVVK